MKRYCTTWNRIVYRLGKALVNYAQNRRFPFPSDEIQPQCMPSSESSSRNSSASHTRLTDTHISSTHSVNETAVEGRYTHIIKLCSVYFEYVFRRNHFCTDRYAQRVSSSFCLRRRHRRRFTFTIQTDNGPLGAVAMNVTNAHMKLTRNGKRTFSIQCGRC